MPEGGRKTCERANEMKPSDITPNGGVSDIENTHPAVSIQILLSQMNAIL